MNNRITSIRSALAVAGVLCALNATADIDRVMQEAEQLIKNERPGRALDLLLSESSNHAGETRFDYLLALALMDSGSNTQAELVFERLLAQYPAFHGARLDYARVLVAQQKYTQAAEQLDTLSGSRPPERALSQIAELNQIIRQRTRAQRWSRYLRLSTAVGYDSNVNSATVVDEFLGFALDNVSREQDSDFIDARVEGGVGYRLQPNLKLSGKLSYASRQNSQASFVDSDALSADVRLVRTTDTDYQQLTLSAYQFDLDGNRNSDGLTLSGVWLRSLTPRWHLGITADAGRIDFEDRLEVRDVDRYKAGLMAVYSFGENGQGQWLLRGGAGTDEPRLADSRFERNFTYAGASLSWRFNSALRSVINVDYQNSQFENVFFEQLYDDKREDDRFGLAASLDWQFRPRWRLSHTLTYARNDTFIDIFEYERFQALLRLSYTFD